MSIPISSAMHFAISIPGLKHGFKVLGFKGSESLNTPYRINVELVSERADLDLESLLHQPAFLAFDQHGTGLHGQVYSAAQGESGPRLSHYRITLVPHLAYLAHSRQLRIFQGLSVPQVIIRVLEGHGILANAYRMQLRLSAYPPRDYCTQYDENDLNFIQRLCAEEGLSYHFQHSPDGHVLVFGEDATVFRSVTSTPYHRDCGMVPERPVISRFSTRLETRTTEVSRRDYDFLQDRVYLRGDRHSKLAKTEQGQPKLEDYGYPGHFNNNERGARLARQALEWHRCDYRLAKGKSNQPLLVSGHFLPLCEHPREPLNDLWLLISVTHEGRQPQVLEEFISADIDDGYGKFQQGYRNHFNAIPWDTSYRPPLDQHRHRIHGSQSAIVTGPEGEEVYCDAEGRVKVQFPWDRDGTFNEHSTCWLRVSTGWAGARFGSMVIPRVGMEVEVSFFEGDPDRPYVSACLYNSSHPTPYPLPQNKTVSVFKTLSTPGGNGFNEVRIEDRKGAEQIYLHAERDWEQIVKHDHSLHIGNAQRTRVKGDCHTELHGEEQRITHADRRVALKASDHLDIGQSQHIRVGLGQYVEAANELHFKAGNKVVIEAGVELTLKAGGCFITLNPGGIWCSNDISVGGAAGAGSGMQLLSPLPLQPPPPALAIAQVSLLQLAQDGRKERCLICEACQEGACDVPDKGGRDHA